MFMSNIISMLAKIMMISATVIMMSVMPAKPVLTSSQEPRRAKTGPSRGRIQQCDSQVAVQSGVTKCDRNETEKEGFEPSVQVYPVQQFSKLSP